MNVRTGVAGLVVLCGVAALGCKTRDGEDLGAEVSAVTQNACAVAMSESVISPKLWRCTSLIARVDADTPNTELSYSDVVETPNACIVEYKQANGAPAVRMVDVANDVDEVLTQFTENRYYGGKNTDWYAWPVSNNYHVYKFDNVNGHMSVSRQVIGFGRFNMYDYDASCTAEAH